MYRVRVATIIVAAFAALCGVSCPGSYDNKRDASGAIEDGIKWDTASTPPDWGGVKWDTGAFPTDTGGKPKDGFIPWPDVTYPDIKPHSDLYPWPPDLGGYTPSPFGCQLDSDCFGIRCCPTPWGVKLCAPVCQY